MFRTPDLGVHVHVLADGDEEVDRYLTFRDRLRSSLKDRMAYKRLKGELMTRDRDEIGLYADAKGLLIETILARARTPANLIRRPLAPGVPAARFEPLSGLTTAQPPRTPG